MSFDPPVRAGSCRGDKPPAKLKLADLGSDGGAGAEGPAPRPPPRPAREASSGSRRRRRREACPPCRAAPTPAECRPPHARRCRAGRGWRRCRVASRHRHAGRRATISAIDSEHWPAHQRSTQVAGRRRLRVDHEWAAGRRLEGGDGGLAVGRIVGRLPPRQGLCSTPARRAGRKAMLMPMSVGHGGHQT